MSRRAWRVPEQGGYKSWRSIRPDYTKSFLPAGLSLVDELAFLTPADKRLLSQVQRRSCAYIFAPAERFISAKVLDISREHWLGDQVVLEALARMSDESELINEDRKPHDEQRCAAVDDPIALVVAVDGTLSHELAGAWRHAVARRGCS